MFVPDILLRFLLQLVPWPGFSLTGSRNQGEEERKIFPSLYVFLSTRELCHVVMVRSAAKKIRRKSQREALKLQEQADALLAMEEDEEVLFKRPAASTDTPSGSRANSPDREEDEPGMKDYTTVLEMVKVVRDRLTELVLDKTNIRAACDDLRRQCHSQGVAFGDLSRLVSQTRADQEETRAYAHEETGPNPSIRPELLDARGNLRARDIGITWQDGDTFLHGVRIAGQDDDMEDNHRRPATAAPYLSCPQQLEDARRQPVMSTPHHQSHGHPPSDMSTPGFPRPVCIEMSDTPAHNFAGPRQEGRPTHRPAAPIQRFNSKSIGWPAWFRHFRAVADVQGWDKDQRALQMVSYLDEKAMNVAQELSDRELYNYDALVGLLSARFDPASRVSASRSRFHGRTRQEDADTYADSITELCRLGYPQSSPELRQELISEQFVRGQSDPELKKYLWVVIRTQKDKKLQTLIEVCTDFASLSHTTSVHRPAEQVFALEEEEDREEEMFAVVDRQQWNTQRAAEPPLSPELQMFALARRMGYEMRLIARRFDAPRQAPGPRLSQNKDYRAPFGPRDYSRTKCFSCGQLGHTQVRCPKPDSSLPFRPSGWVDRSDGPQRGSGGPPQGNEI